MTNMFLRSRNVHNPRTGIYPKNFELSSRHLTLGIVEVKWADRRISRLVLGHDGEATQQGGKNNA